MKRALAAILILLTSPAAAAQPTCGSYAEIVKQLTDKYGEKPSSTAVTTDDLQIEIYRGHKGDGAPTWSIVKRAPGTDYGCLVDAGKGDWQDAKPDSEQDAKPSSDKPIDPSKGDDL